MFARLSHSVRSHLTLLLYLAGLAQIFVIIAGFIALSLAFRPHTGGFERDFEYSITSVLARTTSPGDMQQELQRRFDVTKLPVSVYDEEGRLLASGVRPALPLPAPEQKPQRVIPFRTADGRPARAVYQMPPFGPPTHELVIILVLVLVVVGVTAWIVARSVIKPLTRISETARAFGAGALSSRVALSRPDQIGQVAASFDVMADQVVQMISAQKELLANISHELRTPLARIRVAIDLASEGDADAARESLSEITQDLNELEQLVSDVLTSTRLDLATSGANALPVKTEEVDPAALVERAVARFRSAHPDRQVQVEIGAGSPTIDADPMLLRRALDNLLENAAKYSSAANDPIGLDVSADAGTVQFRVHDKGAGIASEDLPHVFEPFYRADRSRTRKTGGLGLGLTLSKRIAEAHAGSLRLESTPGQGTTAILTVPQLARSRATPSLQ